MSKIHSTLVLATLFCLPHAQAASNAENLNNQVQSQLDRLHYNAKEMADQIQKDIQDQYGLNVDCEPGGLVGWGKLDDGSCYAGMENFNAAIAQIESPVSVDVLKRVHIVIGRLGAWQPLSRDSLQMTVPYNAGPDRISAYVNEQFKNIFATSMADVEKSSGDLAKQIQQQYSLNVMSQPDLDASDYYEGLKRLQVSLSGVYAEGDQPSDKRASDFGFDTVVVGDSYANMYQDDGELRVQVDYKGRPGKTALHLVTQLQPVIDEKPGLAHRVANFGKYTWADVVSFRDQRDQIDELKQWIGENGNGLQVDCILQGPNSIHIDQCVQGLQNVVIMMRQFRPTSYPVGRVLIGGLARERIPFYDWVSHTANIDRHNDTMLIDYSNSAKTIYDRMSQ